MGVKAIETIKKSVCLWVLYDGIENSVFQSQVLNVVNQQLQHKIFDKILVISFEKSLSAAQEVLNRLNINPGLEFAMFKRSAFIGGFSLEGCVEAACNEIFKTFPQQIVARGPIAGFIALKALCKIQDDRQLLQNVVNLPKLTIQARGLLGKEHAFINRRGSWNPFKSLKNWFVGRQMIALEKAVYSEENLAKLAFDIKIEAVTSYLADYLIEEFGASQERIVLAKEDVVAPLPKEKIQQYRQHSRNKLGLMENVLVYCYSGSAKPWQCSKETIDLFWELFENNSTIFFLILTTQEAEFEALFKQKGIPAEHFAIMNIHDQDEYLKWMCAADIGVILRDDHVVNWVSRPTKVLDYLACNLKLKHNNTVGWVIEVSNKLHLQASEQESKLVKAEEHSKVTAAKRDAKITLEKITSKPVKTEKASSKAKTTSMKAESKKPAASSAKTPKPKIGLEKVTAKSKVKSTVGDRKKTAVKSSPTAKKKSKIQANL